MIAIEKKVTINAPSSRVWKALTDQKELEKWILMRTTFVPQKDKEFIFKTDPDQEMQGFFRCKVIEIIEYKKLVFTWRPDQINADTLVTIELNQKGSQTELTLIHSGWEKLPADVAENMKEGHSKGWDLRFVEKLKEVAEK
jgi:uncharacterized protein YndB with AHSA1/START domain